MKINFIGGHKYEIDDVINAQSCVNLYPLAAKDKTPLALKTVPGIKTVGAVGTTGTLTRAFNAKSIITVGLKRQLVTTLVGGVSSNLWEIDADLDSFSAADLGAIHVAGADEISMESNGEEVMIAGGSAANNISVFNLATDAITTVTSVNGDNVVYLEGFFILRNSTFGQRNQLLASDYMDGTTISATNFGVVNARSGQIIRVLSDHLQAVVFCESGIEFWHNAGRPKFPLLRNNSVYIEIGVASYDKESVIRTGERIYWCGAKDPGERSIYVLDGYSPVKISTPAIDDYISDKGVICTGYSRNGHDFLIAHAYDSGAGTGRATFVYDANTGIWHTRKSEYHADWWTDYTPAQIELFGRTLVAIARSNGNTVTIDHYLYKFDEDTFQDEKFNGTTFDGTTIDTTDITRERISQHIYGPDNRELTHKVIEFDFKPVDATIALTWSDDNGVSWSNGRVMKITTLNGQARETDLGSSRNRIYKIVTSSNADIVLLNVWLNNKP